MNDSDEIIVNRVREWFEKAVLGLNLCPFAAKPYRQGRLGFELSNADDDESCLVDLLINLNKLDRQPEIETLVVIYPYHLQSFADYNQFLDLADELVDQQGWGGIYQIASFHPDYCFAGCDQHDRANWTNRSPYPLLHLLREASISQAVESMASMDDIPARNIRHLRDLTDGQMCDLFGESYVTGSTLNKKIPD